VNLFGNNIFQSILILFELQHWATHNTVTKTILSYGNHFKTSSTPPRFIEVPVSSKDSERSCIYKINIDWKMLFPKRFTTRQCYKWHAKTHTIFYWPTNMRVGEEINVCYHIKLYLFQHLWCSNNKKQQCQRYVAYKFCQNKYAIQNVALKIIDAKRYALMSNSP
jgi:hypothetical protein